MRTVSEPTKDVTLHGQTMKTGDFVCLAYGSGNRDERQFPDPDRYDVARKPRGHLGFGGGVHACLGTAIARLSAKIAFEEFHKVFPEYQLLIESYMRAQSVVQNGEQLDSQR